ncbi:head GIN domain-containing protein [Pedobacter frigidisoli]|uniref:head GIN domain-containing protein n=1 Tax=Pedobacter frigidisoli TaxID=2530455 RepID=UPI00292D6D12|nr:head GIN domain-containing protein [Pedobacter frigidisoli]
MKKIFSTLLVALTLTATIDAIAKDQINISSSKRFEDERAVKSFNGVAAAGPINVVLTIGNTESCRLEGDEEALETIVTEVKGNILIIRPQTSITSWSRKYDGKKITAYVTAKSISSLAVSGSGSMVVNGKVDAQSLATTISGSGSIKATADVDNLSAVISGSGSINLSGTAEHAKIVMSSSGAFAGKSFSVSTLSATISGSGQVNIKADESIKAVISGSGSINYSGNATVEKTVIGSGGVRKV